MSTQRKYEVNNDNKKIFFQKHIKILFKFQEVVYYSYASKRR